MSRGRILDSTVMKVLTRSNGRCENPKCRNTRGCQLHHVFFRSQYMKPDKHKSWNLSNICFKCHENIHHNGNEAGISLNRDLKRLAYTRYTGEHKKLIEAILRQTEVNFKKYEQRNKGKAGKLSEELLKKIAEIG